MPDETRVARERSGERKWRLRAPSWLWVGCAALTVAVAFPGHLGVDSSQQLEAARILREQRKPDDFMRIVIDSRCLTAGIYNLVYDPDVDIIEACCAPMRIYHDLDNNVPLPDHCIE
ncbi:MAG TPA: hypothetical protein EYP98_08435 [Planctomycetes bacterium]|nr:hypothetical protein [Planctomycetota bacterium]